MTKSILAAGILGGLLGGAAAFAAGRWIKPADTPQGKQTQSNSTALAEARVVADAFVAKLKAGKFDEFMIDVKVACAAVSDQEYSTFKGKLQQDRLIYGKSYGKSMGEFEALRETALGPNVARFTYLERFEKGGVIWLFVLYRGTETWKLNAVDWSDKLALAFSPSE